jgi:hypothetical protein
MIDQIDSDLKDWVAGSFPGVEVSFELPHDVKATWGGVSFYLIELVEAPPLRGGRRPPLQASLRYLVTTWAENPEAAHHLLGNLVLAAMEAPQFKVELSPIPSAAWIALGVVPRPSFILNLPFRRERAEFKAPLVRMPPIVKGAPIASLRGVVVGKGERPVAGATVTLPALGLSTRTDIKGRFHFPAVPREPFPKQLSVEVKGRALSIVLQPGRDDQPLLVHLKNTEA